MDYDKGNKHKNVHKIITIIILFKNNTQLSMIYSYRYSN